MGLKLTFFLFVFILSSNFNESASKDLTQKEEIVNHSGGTNSSGCHNDRKNGGYHCH